MASVVAVANFDVVTVVVVVFSQYSSSFQSWSSFPSPSLLVLVFPTKHRLNCKCCPGHYLIVNN